MELFKTIIVQANKKIALVKYYVVGFFYFSEREGNRKIEERSGKPEIENIKN